ncbi:MAG: VCBS repeat-containing protein [Candidatus Eisenbacteria bacterium]|nr:VCBS repeat-containing protein [Candidatus Eisenbacteria bacterium]
MARTAIGVVMAAMSLLWSATAAGQSAVYWTPAHEWAPTGLLGCIAAGDLDGDGDDDLASFRWGGVYWNMGCPGPPAWQLQANVFPDARPFGCHGGEGTLGDIDGDGDLDLIYGCYECCSLRVFWNVGTPQVPTWQYGGAVPGNPYAGYYSLVCLADIDADGDLDLLGRNGDGIYALIAYENVGTPWAPLWVRLGLIPEVYGVSDSVLAVGDIDGDGDLDIVGGSYSSRLKCWENVGTPQAWSYVRNDAMLTGVAATIGVTGVALLDLDCDGDLDLVIVGRLGAVSVYLNEQITPVGSGTWGTIKALYR